MINHHPNCRADYPEKPTGEKPRGIVRQVIDTYYVDTCVDCGAFETDLPPEDDPYWDEAKEQLKEMEKKR